MMKIFFLVFYISIAQLGAFGKLNEFGSPLGMKNEVSLSFNQHYPRLRYFKMEGVLDPNNSKSVSIDCFRSFSRYFSANVGFDFYNERRMVLLGYSGGPIWGPGLIRLFKFNMGVYYLLPIIYSRNNSQDKTYSKVPLLFFRTGINYFRCFVHYEAEYPGLLFRSKKWNSELLFFEVENRLYIRFSNEYALFFTHRVSHRRPFGINVWGENYAPMNSFGIGISYIGR